MLSAIFTCLGEPLAFRPPGSRTLAKNSINATGNVMHFTVAPPYLHCGAPSSVEPAMPPVASDVAFSPAVKAVQAKRGSRDHFVKAEERGGWRTAISADLAGFLGEARSFY